MITITIDGLSTNGKTTLANMLAKQYNFKNYNTGALYRCIALIMIRNDLNIKNIKEVLAKIKDMKVDFKNECVYLNEEDVTRKIKEEEISILSNQWATNLELKKYVKKHQREYIKKYNVIMEGRDIGTRIVPNATVKFYLHSDFESRVDRKWQQNKNKSKEDIRKELAILDDIDINCGNFVIPTNAFSIDTTNFTLEEVYKKMVAIIDKKLEK